MCKENNSIKLSKDQKIKEIVKETNDMLNKRQTKKSKKKNLTTTPQDDDSGSDISEYNDENSKIKQSKLEENYNVMQDDNTKK